MKINIMSSEISCYVSYGNFSLHIIRLPVMLQFLGVEFQAGLEDMWRTTCCDLSFVVCCIMLMCIVMWKSKILMMQSNGPLSQMH